MTNHYTMLACASSHIPCTISLTNYADGTDASDDIAFLANEFSFSMANLFRLLTILTKPKNKHNFTYNGIEDNLHSFSVEHSDDYSALNQFVIDNHVFHVRKIVKGKIHAEKCTKAEFNIQSGYMQMLSLPLSNLSMGDSIEFDIFGLYCRITSAGRFCVYTSKLQRGMSLDPILENSDISTSSQYCIVYGENDFAIVGDETKDSIRQFVYMRREENRVIVVTPTDCGIHENGVFSRYYYGNRGMITDISSLASRADVEQFALIPVFLTVYNTELIDCPLVWCIQRINDTGNAFILSGNYVVAPTTDRPCIAFSIGENR